MSTVAIGDVHGNREALEDLCRYSWLTVMQGLATVASYSAAADALEQAIEPNWV